jgi:hypothetical protein
MSEGPTFTDWKAKAAAGGDNFTAGVTGKPTLPASLGPLAQLANLLLLAEARQRGSVPSLPKPPEELRAAVTKLIVISTAEDGRGARARAAWRKLAEGGLELIRALNDDPAPNDCT